MESTQRKDRERIGWGARAESYSKITARATVQAIPALLHAARLAPFTRLLDVACGPGYAAGAAAALGCQALGVDISGEMVAVARARQLSADFEIGDAEALHHGDRAFDMVVCNFGVFHFPTPETAFAEALRVLRPGGRYAFSQWSGPEESALFGLLLTALRAHVDTEADLAGIAAGLRFSDRERCRKALEAAGFVEVEIAEAPVAFKAPEGDFLAHLSAFAVGVSSVIDRLAEDKVELLRADLAAAVAPYLGADGFDLPAPAFIVSGAKPGAGA